MWTLIATRDARAQELGYHARLTMMVNGRVTLNFAAAVPSANKLRLNLHHPTRAGFDREILLARAVDGSYAAVMPPIDASRWSMTLEDENRTWRLTGDWRAGESTVQLGGTS